MRLRMGTTLWRALVLVAALQLCTRTASAQTVITTNAPPGTTVEFVLNGATVGSAQTDASGSVTLTAKTGAIAADMDAHIYVDTCENLRRIVVIERSRQPEVQPTGCQRAQIAGVFLVRPISTLAVNVGGITPSVLLRQGKYTPRAPHAGPAFRPPSGLVVFGGGGIGTISDPVFQACGDITECSGDSLGFPFGGGVGYWFGPYIAAEATYLKPSNVNAEGRTPSYRFDSMFESQLVTIAGVVGIPAKRARIYGKIGMTFTEATFETTQINDDVTVTNADGTTTTIAGGTTTYELKTEGWGWMFGGGAEIWFNRKFAIYMDGGRAGMKGSAREDVDGETDDALMYFVAGARFRIGR
jgi:hypothetical protein